MKNIGVFSVFFFFFFFFFFFSEKTFPKQKDFFLKKMSESREENVYMAKLAEQAERYDEMVDFMKRVAALKVFRRRREIRNKFLKKL